MTYPIVESNLDFEIGQHRPLSETTVITAGEIENQRAAAGLVDNTPKRYNSPIEAIRDLATATVSGALWENLLRIYVGGANCPTIVVKAESDSIAHGSAAIAAARSRQVIDQVKEGRTFIDYALPAIVPASAAPVPLASAIVSALATTAEAIGAMFVVSAALYPIPLAGASAATLNTAVTNLNAWLAGNYQNNGIFLPFAMHSTRAGASVWRSASGYIMGALAYWDGVLKTNAYVTHYRELPDMLLPSITVTPVGATDAISLDAPATEAILPDFGLRYQDANMVDLVNANYIGIFRHNGFHMAGNEIGINPTSIRGRTGERYIGVQRYAKRMQADAVEIAQPYTGLIASPSDQLGMVRNINDHEAVEIGKTRGYVESAEVEFNRIEENITYLTGRIVPVGPNEGVRIDIAVGA